MTAKAHIITVHGITGPVRERDWDVCLREGVGAEVDRWHSVYWADLASIASMQMDGDNVGNGLLGMPGLWDYADDFLFLLCLREFSRTVQSRITAKVEEVPEGHPICFVAHSAGGFAVMEWLARRDGLSEQRWPVKRLVTVCVPLRVLAFFATQGHIEAYPWPRLPNGQWFNLHCAKTHDPVSRRRGRVKDLAGRLVHEIDIWNLPPHSGWQRNCTVRRLVREVA